MSRSNLFDLNAIREIRGLGEFRFLPETGSTNDVALDWIRSTLLTAPALVLTGKQIRGRGQLDRKWHSSPGDIAASWIFPVVNSHSKPIQHPGIMAIATAVALQATLACSKPAPNRLPTIKWPNDILFGCNKAAGILVEIVFAHQNYYAVTGIGINANGQLPATDQHRSSMELIPTSLSLESGHPANLTELVSRLTSQLLIRIDQINSNREQLLADYMTNMFGTNDRMQVVTGSTTLSGICRGISSGGALRLETDEGIIDIVSGRIAMDSIAKP